MPDPQKQIKQLEEELSRLKAQVAQAAISHAEKDRIEDEFQRSQQRFRTVFEKSAIGKKIINDQLQIIKVNNALLQTLGYTEYEMLGKLITDFAHPDHVEYWKALQQKLWTTDLPSFSFDTCVIKRDGAVIWAHITTILIDDNGSRLGYTIFEDISARKELEHLRDLVREQEQRQQIAQTILNTQEEERRRVGESLHNSLGQLLYGAKLSLSQLKVKSAGNEEALQYTQQLITESIKECRRISHDLMPAMLVENGLKAAVEEICHQLSGDVRFESHISGLRQRIADFVEVAIYRIIQELMVNIVKHAFATEALVHIKVHETAIHILVKDNGKGFDEAALKTKGIGLQTTRYKVSLLSGTFKLSSEKGKGTAINISIPTWWN